MLLNIMYYDLSQQAKAEKKTESGGIFIGPLHITPQQVDPQ